MTYREALLNAASNINFFLDELLSSLFEITMTGELKEWSDNIPDGESHTLDMDLFKALNDVNAASLVHAYELMENKYEFFLNINAISMEEIEKYRTKKFNDMCGTDDADNGDEGNLDDELPF